MAERYAAVSIASCGRSNLEFEIRFLIASWPKLCQDPRLDIDGGGGDISVGFRSANFGKAKFARPSHDAIGSDHKNRETRKNGKWETPVGI